MGDRLRDFWADLIGLIPEFLLFLLILVVGIAVAKLLEKGTDKLLNRLRVNRLFSRNVEQATSKRVAWNVVGVLSKVVFWFVILFTLYFAFGVFGDTNPFFLFFAGIVAFIPKLVVALFIMVAAIAIAGIVRGLVAAMLDGFAAGRVLSNIVGGFILGIGVIAALTQVGIAVAVTLPMLYFFLFTLSGIAIVGFGGALIGALRQPMMRLVNAVDGSAGEVAQNVNTDVSMGDVVVTDVDGDGDVDEDDRRETMRRREGSTGVAQVPPVVTPVPPVETVEEYKTVRQRKLRPGTPPVDPM